MPDTSAQAGIGLAITGRQAAPALPAALLGTARSAGGAEDNFLPPGFLRPVATYDVSPAARGAGAAPFSHAAAPDEIVVLELADGGTLVTSAARLRDALARAHPELVDGNTVQLEALREASAMPGRGLGGTIKGVIRQVYVLAAGADGIVRAALEKHPDRATLGVSWHGTAALMQAIEARLGQPGLHRWRPPAGAGAVLQPVTLADANDGTQPDPAANPMLVFLHGTGSNTLGSFGDLRDGDGGHWAALAARFGDNIFGFEHRTLSESPIENAIALLEALPRGAHVSLASHSRGGLVADLLCLGDFDTLIDGYKYEFEGSGDATLRQELGQAHEHQREQLRTLAALKRERKIVVQRYVRAACPANGTLLASGNFDVFLSSLLTLIGAVPWFFGNPLYSAFKRVVIEIARNRTDAHMVPGIEAMLPDSPLARLLRDAPVQPGIDMAVIAGDTEADGMLARLGVMLADFLLFDKEDNDLVVNTPAMLAGIAPQAHARVLFDRGAGVTHFRYFANPDTRTALCDWLASPAAPSVAAFRPLPGAADYAAALEEARSRSGAGAPRPVVVVIPGIMGSHLAVNRSDRVWYEPLDLLRGGIGRIGWGKPGVEADELFEQTYGQLCASLARTHRVVPFPYDWRQPLDVLGERLGEFLDRLLKELGESGEPVRLLAHSMGGLVVRACFYKRPVVMQSVMEHEGARLVMLGTPNQGAHSMVENLLGKGDSLRSLARLDLAHSMQELLDIVAGFRGALQLLPKPGFRDTFQGEPGGGGLYGFQEAGTWAALKEQVTDFWFGDKRCGVPRSDALAEASWLWKHDGEGRPALPEAWAGKSVYVFGVARNTTCGVREERAGAGVRLKLVGTARGDGTVTWDSGRIGNIGAYYYMPVRHGDLLSTPDYFDAVGELLATGATARLDEHPPAMRGAGDAGPVTYDAGPPRIDDAQALQRSLMGASLQNWMQPRPLHRLSVRVMAMDLRFVARPIMVGHYDRDPIAGPEALIDRELLGGDLGKRYRLGLYAGQRGTATVVLRGPADPRHRRASLSGAVVTGLGSYDVPLSAAALTEAIHVGALRYLLQVVDVLGKGEREVPLASLLLGYNSSASLTVAASVEALVRGVMQANTRFRDTTGLDIRIGSLDIVELYTDTAITAAYALRGLDDRLAAQAETHRTALVTSAELVRGEGMRQRLSSDGVSNYWPRMIVTAAREPGDAAPECDPGPGAHAAGAAPLADRLRFMYVGQRARAETVVHQRQPNLVEALVAKQVRNTTWNDDFSRMLFQLMVPHDFKDAARQLERVVLVVDSQTANLPWELMLADSPGSADAGDRYPLAVRAAMVRQFSSLRFRTHVMQASKRTALVIGNPAVAGFGPAFPGLYKENGGKEPAALTGAAREAMAAAEALRKADYAVEPLIGDAGRQVLATDVLSLLYRQPWRILHISAHGLFDAMHADGQRRSGVLLSDGLLITAAEIAAMEVVPELVFLNCCHLGQVDLGAGRNRLAASVSRELIEIGVRCVVVAGWAVDDGLARCFGETFYRHLLTGRRPFGDAVLEARKATWRASSHNITWGAYQAYGDPAWTAEPQAAAAPASGAGGRYVALEEALDALARTRVGIAQRGAASAADTSAVADSIRDLVDTRCPEGWRELPDLYAARGGASLELNLLEQARTELLRAIQDSGEPGAVPIRDIERLVTVETMLAEKLASEAPAALQPAHAMLDLALVRLDGLAAVATIGAEGAPPASGQAGASARSALRGRVWQTKAGLHARQLQAGEAPGEAGVRAAMAACLKHAAEAFGRAEGSPGGKQFSCTAALERLALEALPGWQAGAKSEADLAQALALARHCSQFAEQAFADGAGSAAALAVPRAQLVEHLIKGSFGQDAPGVADVIVEELAQSYAGAVGSLALKPSEIAAMAADIASLARLCDALAAAADDPTAQTARRLNDLASRLSRGAPERRMDPAH